MLGISESCVWDEPLVITKNKGVTNRPKKPDLIVLRDGGIWWWEMMARKNAVSSSDIKGIFKEKIEKVQNADVVKIVRKDGEKEVNDKKVTKTTIICGEGGFTAPAYTFSREHNLDLKRPEDLKVVVVASKRVSNARLLGIEIRVVPEGSKETFYAPKEVVLPELH